MLTRSSQKSKRMDGGLVTATVSLIEEVDSTCCTCELSYKTSEKIMVVLRDGRNIVGTMRSFDQYGVSNSQ